jgi:hypothetical protein
MHFGSRRDVDHDGDAISQDKRIASPVLTYMHLHTSINKTFEPSMSYCCSSFRSLLALSLLLRDFCVTLTNNLR